MQTNSERHATMNHRFLSYSTVFLRVALGVTFLAAVTDRFGLWGPPGTNNVSWGNFESFLGYTALLNPYLPAAWIPVVGWLVTVAETVLGLALIAGIQTRKVAALSSVLLLAFAFGMMVGTGIKAPLNYSVFSSSAGALLLATAASYPWSVDAWQQRRWHA